MSRRQSALRSEEHTSELQSLTNIVCRLLLEKKKIEGIMGVMTGFSPLPLPGEAGLSASMKIAGGFKLFLSLKLVTPLVVALCVGSTRCLFSFSRPYAHILYRDIETWDVIALLKYANDIAYRMCFFFTSSRLFLPRNWRTPWTEVRAFFFF